MKNHMQSSLQPNKCIDHLAVQVSADSLPIFDNLSRAIFLLIKIRLQFFFCGVAVFPKASDVDQRKVDPSKWLF